MSSLYEDIKAECEERGLGESEGRCIYARYYACVEHDCPIAKQFCGKRPADLLVERYNLRAQYERDMRGENE